MLVYVLAASGATHFLEEYASAREAADDMGVADQTMNNAVCRGHRGGLIGPVTSRRGDRIPLSSASAAGPLR